MSQFNMMARVAEHFNEGLDFLNQKLSPEGSVAAIHSTLSKLSERLSDGVVDRHEL